MGLIPRMYVLQVKIQFTLKFFSAYNSLILDFLCLLAPIISKAKHSKTKTEARTTQISKQSTQISKMEHPRLEDKAPKSLACEHTRFASLFAAGDISRGGTSATQQQKFHTDDIKSVQNPVRSADWSAE